ncbi:MAG: trypsin-like peptidase domain-containing protein [Planctomycetes bacterium]|nr:trypsin-like peptidase domain-containing protein [Planctomycetota bacterium]
MATGSDDRIGCFPFLWIARGSGFQPLPARPEAAPTSAGSTNLGSTHRIQQVVWYVEASTDPLHLSPARESVDPQQGTAVMVRLESGEVPDAQSCSLLLTCRHVVYDGGTALPHIRCWPYNCGVTSDTSWSAEAWNGTVSHPCGADAKDWILLKVTHSASASQDSDGRAAAIPAPSDSQPDAGSLRLVGYPGGRKYLATVQDKTLPAVEAEFATDAGDADPAMIYLRSSATRPGLSGGGYFDSEGRLHAIHRERIEATRQCRGILLSTIANWLADKGWRFVRPPSPPPPPPPPTLWIVAAIALGAALLLVVIWGCFLSSSASVEKRLRVKLNQITFDQQRQSIVSRISSPEVEVTFVPSSFEPIEIKPATTDSTGVAEIRITVARHDEGAPLRGHLACLNVPARFSGTTFLVTTRHGCVKRGEVTELLGKSLDLTKDREIEVDVIPYELRRLYYQIDLANLLDEALQRPELDSKVGGDPALVIARIGSEHGLDMLTLENGAEHWISDLTRERPAIEAEHPVTWQGADLSSIAILAKQAVCAVLDKQGEPLATGLVVAPARVLTFGSDVATRVGSIRFGYRLTERQERTWPATVVMSPETHGFALLNVPGVPGSNVALLDEQPGFDLADRQVVVIGYPMGNSSDSLRTPDIVFQRLFGTPTGVLRLMPGVLLGVESSGLMQDNTACLSYDATTCPGVAGGPVIDLHSGCIIGLHYGGSWKGTRKSCNGIASWDIVGAFHDELEKAKANLVRADALVETLPNAQPDDAAGSSELPRVPYDPDFLSRVSVPLPRDVLGRTLSPVLDYLHYSVAMHRTRRLALFTACNSDRERTQDLRREAEYLRKDVRIPADSQTGIDAYPGIPPFMDRGRLVTKSGVAWGSFVEARDAYRSTNYVTNVCPVLVGFNRNAWVRLRNHVVATLAPEARRSCVFSGPVLQDDDAALSDVAESLQVDYRGSTPDLMVPQSYWIVAAFADPSNDSDLLAYAFLASQYEIDSGGKIVVVNTSQTTPDGFAVSVETIEKLTGLDFGVLRNFDQDTKRR